MSGTPDGYTLIFVGTITKLILSLIFIFYWHFQKTYRGFGCWVVSTGLTAITGILYLLRNQVHDVWSVVLANICAIAAFGFRLEGARVFFGMKYRWGCHAVALGVSIVVLSWFTIVTNDIFLRTLFIAGVLSVYSVSIAWTFVRNASTSEKRPAQALAFFYLLFAATGLTRAFSWAMNPQYRSLFGSEWVNVSYLLIEIVSSISVVFLLILINGLRITAELHLEKERSEAAERESVERISSLNAGLETKVTERTAELEELYNSAPCGYHSINADGIYVRINDTELDWLGYSREEIVGQRGLREFVTAASVGVFDAALAKLTQDGATRGIEFEIRSRSGQLRSVIGNADALLDDDGMFLMSRTTIFDITDRRRAELLLQEREKQLQEFLDNASDPIHMTDATGRFIYVNNAWLDLFGYTRDELKEVTLYDLIHPSEHQRRDNLISGSSQGERALRGEYIFLTKDRQPIFIETVTNIRYENGRFAGTQGILTDVTARKKLEETLRESRDHLGEANLEMARAARLKDEFLASMSHELRTPLTAVIGLSEVMLEGSYGKLAPEQAEAVQMIERSGRHLLELINDILDLSKLEAKQVELDVEDCSATDVSQASMQFVRNIAKKKNISLHFETEPASISLQADPRRLKQMLINLLSNAVKFTPVGGEAGLSIRLDESSGSVNFTVWDKGIGIKAEDFPKLFQPFTQIDSSLARQHAGTGLGLVLVQRTARMHGGDVTFESKPGEGSRFTIRLPWKQSIVEDAGVRWSEFMPQRVLVVEDNPSDAKLLVALLQKLSCGSLVHGVANGAMDKAVEYDADAILLDVQLPDRSGWEVLAELKKNPATRNTPVIIVSVLEDRIRAASMRAAGYLVKPVNLTGLGAELRKAMRGKEEMASEIEAAEQAECTVMPQADPLVLLADDSDDNVKVVVSYLRNKPWRMLLAANGNEAVAQARKHRPDLILMDIQMPQMDGLTAIGVIRADTDPCVAAVPIIAMTALAMTGDKERCLAAGANDYVSKPIDFKELLDKMRHWTQVKMQ